MECGFVMYETESGGITEKWQTASQVLVAHGNGNRDGNRNKNSEYRGERTIHARPPSLLALPAVTAYSYLVRYTSPQLGLTARGPCEVKRRRGTPWGSYADGWGA